MIQANDHSLQTPAWRRELATAITDPAELLDLLELSPNLLPGALAAGHTFKMRIPRSYAQRIRKGDAADPLLRQVLPVGGELVSHSEFCTDPLGEVDAMPVPGILHKYRGRALVITTGACAVHCRYCFRRHFPYSDASSAANQWQEALRYIADDPSITEIVLSGGDPLTLSDRRLAALARGLCQLPHLKRLRIHTRLPIVLPSRVDLELQGWLRDTPLQKIVVVHANHAQELDSHVRRGVAALRASGATLLNQAVLLRGVNDSVAAQVALCERLFSMGILPYYLHQLDKVQGAAHFFVDQAVAREIIQGVRSTLPGYLAPRLVVDRKGHPAKVLLG